MELLHLSSPGLVLPLIALVLVTLLGDVSTQGTYVPMYNTVLGNDVYNIMNVEALVAWVGLTLHGGHC